MSSQRCVSIAERLLQKKFTSKWCKDEGSEIGQKIVIGMCRLSQRARIENEVAIEKAEAKMMQESLKN